jgi:hypothetical protein
MIKAETTRHKMAKPMTNTPGKWNTFRQNTIRRLASPDMPPGFWEFLAGTAAANSAYMLLGPEKAFIAIPIAWILTGIALVIRSALRHKKQVAPDVPKWISPSATPKSTQDATQSTVCGFNVNDVRALKKVATGFAINGTLEEMAKIYAMCDRLDGGRPGQINVQDWYQLLQGESNRPRRELIGRIALVSNEGLLGTDWQNFWNSAANT